MDHMTSAQVLAEIIANEADAELQAERRREAEWLARAAQKAPIIPVREAMDA